MTRFPNITVEQWTEDGPAYTVHHSLAGWRNRKLRRSGGSDAEQVGDHRNHRSVKYETGPAAEMVWADGDDELWAFNARYVYSVHQSVDGGEEQRVLVDARDSIALHSFHGGIRIEHWHELNTDELDALDDLDASEAAEAAAEEAARADLAAELAEHEQRVRDAVAGPERTEEEAAAARDAAFVSAANELYGTPAGDPVDIYGEPIVESSNDDADLEEFTEEQLEALTAPEVLTDERLSSNDDAYQTSDGDDEDAVIGGDDSGKSSSDEEE